MTYNPLPNPKTLALKPETLPKPETALKPKLPKPQNPQTSTLNPETLTILYRYGTTVPLPYYCTVPGLRFRRLWRGV